MKERASFASWGSVVLHLEASEYRHTHLSGRSLSDN